MLLKQKFIASPKMFPTVGRSFRSERLLPEPCPSFDAARRARVDVSGRPSPRHHLHATERKASQQRRALACAAGAEPRAKNRRWPIFEHGEHPPVDAPEHRGTVWISGLEAPIELRSSAPI
jgi:hypothetical protein